MGADYWINCPICGTKNGVRVDGTYDVVVSDDKTLDCSEISAYCTKCKTEFNHPTTEGKER